ncbi:alpha-L-fucosidase [Acidobacterium sp. S8]|uniref:alpha-L-fucosidase n=1 Tax=Acidobacterium sp. S8 TaxID=1641854 RepID=UPI00131A7551|nr:alpha-L-fucosidase [Acidobacterium sp. S8]
MSAYIPGRREFLRLAAATSCLSFLPGFSWAQSPACDRTSWYRNAKFGMFIHWGPYSQASVEASWPIMRPKPGGITEADYVALAKTFNPVKYDPHAFVDLARSAGQEYMVFTTKHHDGFCMFDSDYTDYKITKSPYGKDIVAMLAKACGEDNMPLGFYYSPPDMHHPDFRDTTKLARDNWNGEPQRPEWPGYLRYMQLQLTELLTRYGPAAIIWFDGLSHQEKYDGVRVLEMIRELQPETLVNDRIGVDADYETPEQFIPTAIPTKGVVLTGIDPKVSAKLSNTVPRPEDFRLWETCMTINNTWAYNSNDHDYKSEQTLIRSLVEVASRGGNFLLNVGPQPDGQIQPEFQQRLRAIGDWLTLNGDSIYGTTYGPVQGLPTLRTTAKGKNIYAHIFDWPARTCEIAGIDARVLSARLLANGKPLTFHQAEGKLKIDVSPQAPDPNVSVIAIKTY